jgi:hypothetical protein
MELNDERKTTNIAFRTDEDHPTVSEKFWESRLYPVLKDAQYAWAIGRTRTPRRTRPESSKVNTSK